jgi:hypothetical protein
VGIDPKYADARVSDTQLDQRRGASSPSRFDEFRRQTRKRILQPFMEGDVDDAKPAAH